MDAAGNLYGTTIGDGAYGQGNIFKLAPSNGGWTYTSLHDFTGGSDGGQPFAQVTFDASGNLYGTAGVGGINNKGVVWEISLFRASGKKVRVISRGLRIQGFGCLGVELAQWLCAEVSCDGR
jgi:uncharacterized repeat protein (TIGR03803 family)